jgi:hypothetical protein
MDESCPFHEKREVSAVAKCRFQNEEIPIILRHADVMAAAKDWQT